MTEVCDPNRTAAAGKTKGYCSTVIISQSPAKAKRGGGKMWTHRLRLSGKLNITCSFILGVGFTDAAIDGGDQMMARICQEFTHEPCLDWLVKQAGGRHFAKTVDQRC